MIIGTVVVVLLTLCDISQGIISVQNFYPYGLANGDSALPDIDDTFRTISITFDFPFFGTTYRQLHISTNGIINLGAGTNSYTPQPFPIRDFRSIAAYWTDSNPASGGDIFYRETTNATILNRITNEVRSKFIGQQSFASTWAVIMTYDRVAQYGCSSSRSDCARNCSDTLMYQAILTSDGRNSFSMFLYNDLPFTSGTANCNGHAQIGFNAGDGLRFYLVPSSNTQAIASAALTQSNVGVPGLWMFSIEGTDIGEGCNTHGKLEIYPRKTLYFGREDITISGPCFSETQGNVTVTFGGGLQVICQISNLTQLRCAAPYFTTIGSMQVILTYRNILYTTIIVTADIEDRLVVDSDSIHRNVEDLDESCEITWDASAFSGSESMVLLRGFQIDTILSEDNDFESEIIIPLDIGSVRNTGLFVFHPVSNAIPNNRLIRRVALVLYALENRLQQIVRIITLAPTTICERQCRRWYNKQPSSSEMRDIVDQISTRSPCAPAVSTNFPELTGNFEIDSSCQPSRAVMCSIFHPGAKACYRSTNNFGGKVVQCCYDGSGRLMLGPPGGGTLDFADSKQAFVEHQWQDVIPYLTCCKCSNLCSLYYEKRPSIDSRRFVPPGWGNGGGDPHFITIDGTEYTFNPVGEFDYAIVDKDTVQVRISQFLNENNVPKQASYFSAFVVKSDSSDTIQVELNEIRMFRFRVNGESVSMDFGKWSFNGIVLNYFNMSLATVRTSSGVGAEIHINGEVLNIILSIPETAKGKVSGLVGNWDGSRDNDLQLRNGTWIPPTSSQLEIHDVFGMSWTTTNASSLFTYPTGLSWYDYQNVGFVPQYSQPPQNPQCNGNAQCNYDAYVTGNVRVGLANVARSATAAEQASISIQLSQYCPLTVTVNNGRVEVEEITPSHVIYSTSCNVGFKLEGNAKVTCKNGTYDPLPTCLSTSKSSSTQAAWLLITSASLAALTKLY